MRNGTREKRELQRKTVLDAAAKLFSERGFGGTSLGDIAKALNISRPALYYYFSSKDEILSSLVDRVSVYSMKMIHEIMSKDLDPVTKLHDISYNQLIFILRNQLAYMVVVKTEEDLIAETKRMNGIAKRGVFEGFRSVIEAGQASGHFRQGDSAVMALGIIGMCSWCAWWYRGDGRSGEHEVAEQLSQMALMSVLKSDNPANVRNGIDSAVNTLEEVLDQLRSFQRQC